MVKPIDNIENSEPIADVKLVEPDAVGLVDKKTDETQLVEREQVGYERGRLEASA